MKYLSGKLSFLVAFFCLTACTKGDSSSNQNKQASLVGIWILINDSAYTGTGVSNRLVDYTGETGDYFNFSTNGYVYTKENTKLDTLAYSLISDTSIIISNFGLITNGVPDTSIITGLNENNGTGVNVQTIFIESHLGITPGGEFWRKVTLRSAAH
jgi:hypothetical protein